MVVWIRMGDKWLRGGKWWDRMVHMWEKVGNRESDPDLQHGMVKTEITPRIASLWEQGGAGVLF